MSKKEELAKEYSFNIPSEVYNTSQTDVDKLLWKIETERAFEAGWDAVIKEIKAEIKRRRNESTWAEYNEALDDMLSFINTMEE